MIYWYYHDISKYQAPPHLVTSRPTFDMMISVLTFWHYHDISKYQAPPHLVTSRPTFDIMIIPSISWHYHDILILSWYIKISSPSTLSHIQANTWCHDIGIDILILSWYSQNIESGIIISNVGLDVTKCGGIYLVTSRPTFDIMIPLSIFWYCHDILILSWYIKQSRYFDISMIYHAI